MLRLGHFIALIALCLLTIGVVMVNSADMRVASPSGENVAPAITAESILLSRSTIYMALALGAMCIGAMLPVRRFAESLDAGGAASGFFAPARLGGHEGGVLSPAARGLLIASLALVAVCALVYVPGLSKEINGARRWLRLPVPGLGDALSVQPSEIAKWGMVGLLAWYGAAAAPRIHRFWGGLVPALLCIGGVSALIVKEDLGTGVLIAGVSSLVLIAAGARLWQFMIFAPLAVAGVVFAILTSDYRVKRILAFVDPYADPQGIGYHTIQSLIAIANGEGWGRGLGHGLQKFGYLPEDRTDFIFPIICEELGIAGAGVVCLLFAALMACGWSIVRREPLAALRLFAFGVIATIGLQAVINLAVVTGLAPTKGIALPLLSSGGTGWILTSFCLGLVISIERTQDAPDHSRALAAA
ncbi:MAG: putative peptidoglycan glycosyltransferase FtsW [Planctomycetota bacterium]|nr:putative peptidoglycan glycosyltransferase FtsW [Planctomycetota bacterium]